MKITNIILLSFIVLLSGCSVYENIMDDGNTKIVRAGYNKWSEPPARGDVPEKGTDLAVLVENWPRGATPSYIIHENWKSLGANISTTSDMGVVINARVIKASSMMNTTSQQVDESDRLVYVDGDGNTQVLEIEEWSRIDDKPSDSE